MTKIESLKNLKKEHPIYVIAHRGANSECPENTMLSFQTAVDIGADLIEFDVHKTKDDEIVIIHDESTKRVSKVDKNVEESTFSEISGIDIGKGEHIPRLDDLFEKFRSKIGFQIEIKQAGITDLILEKMKKYQVMNECLISSFKHDELVKIRTSCDSIPLGALDPGLNSGAVKTVLLRKYMIENAKTRDLQGVHPYFRLVNADFIKTAHDNGLFVNVWTVDEMKDWKKLIEWDIDGIITNNPRALIKFLEN